MTGKRKSSTSDSDTVPNRKIRRPLSMEKKVAIIKRLEGGEKMVNVARALSVNRSTIGTVYKDKERILEHVKNVIPMTSTVICKKRGKCLEEMERLLTVWIEHQTHCRMPLSLMLIQEKARSLFTDLKTKEGEENEETFTASHGWFNRFKARIGLHNLKLSGEAASADTKAAKEFPDVLKGIIEAEGYTPQQIFNVDETGLFWKKMPSRTYISIEEKSAPGYKAAKDRLTLMLGGNAAGDCKLKPLLVYHSANPRAFKNVNKSTLPVIWMSNPKAWVTMALFQDWFYHHFIPEVKLFCREHGLPFKILLLLDNAPGHPPHLDDFHPDVKVVYLPPNTTSLIQPMDQGVIATFKRYYTRRIHRQALKAVGDQDAEKTLREFWKGYNVYDCVKNIDASWREVAQTTMNGVWKYVTPQFVNDFHGFNVKEVQKNVMDNLVDISKGLQLDLEVEDFEELLDSHSEELSNEDLMLLEEQRRVEEEPEEPMIVKKFETKLLAEAFSHFEKGLELLENQDPNTERFSRVATGLHDNIHCYQVIYEEKKRKTTQTSLDRFFRPAAPRPSTSAATPGPSTPGPSPQDSTSDSRPDSPDSPDSSESSDSEA